MVELVAPARNWHLRKVVDRYFPAFENDSFARHTTQKITRWVKF